MVDSVNSVGQAQSLQSVSKPSASKQGDVKKADTRAPLDKVQISSEALDLAQAEQAAKDVAATLSYRAEATLSDDNARLNALA